jgi:homogentisate 1,2-dioxygenase
MPFHRWTDIWVKQSEVLFDKTPLNPTRPRIMLKSTAGVKFIAMARQVTEFSWRQRLQRHLAHLKFRPFALNADLAAGQRSAFSASGAFRGTFTPLVNSFALAPLQKYMSPC